MAAGCSGLLFVYGTLRRRADGDPHPLLQPWAEYVASAQITGQLYLVSHYPALVPGRRGSRVCGEVYRLHNPRRALRELDRYEECGPGFPQPAEYRRELRAVTLQYGHIVNAWVYIYNWRTDNLKRIASGDFLR